MTDLVENLFLDVLYQESLGTRMLTTILYDISNFDRARHDKTMTIAHEVIAILLLALFSVALAKEEKEEKKDEKPRDTRDVRDVFVSPFTSNYYQPFNYRRPHVYTAPTFDYQPTVKYAYKSAEAAAPILKQSSQSHLDGSYNYEYETGNGIRAVESSLQNGLEHVVRGSYSYVAPDGKTYTVHYIADRNGYRAYGDHLPQQPDEVAPLEAARVLTPAASVVVPVESSTVHPVVSVTPSAVVAPKSVVVPPKTGYYVQPRYYNPYNAYNPYFAPSYQHYLNPNPYQPYFVSTVAPPFLKK
ncbi:cuticle protein-like [Phlebotomus argentipes]|uniref:cuticle protein-like n=1 Tax=Phlebotomus argentipes TaxID=94469 RepID=UPI0028933E8F|nr:cuticle protein-like [Phlebotomus argentipes]